VVEKGAQNDDDATEVCLASNPKRHTHLYCEMTCTCALWESGILLMNTYFGRRGMLTEKDLAMTSNYAIKYKTIVHDFDRAK
jgi:hypothetical protein